MAKKQQEKKKQEKRQASGTERQRGVAKLLGYGVVLLLLAIIVVTIASQFFDTPLLAAPRRFVARVITPVQNVFSNGTDAVVDYLRTLKRRSNLEAEYQALLDQVDDLKDQAMQASELQRQLLAMGDLNDELTRNSSLDGIKASVIGRDTSNYTYTLTIDVGSRDGIEENMAVCIRGALVGITYDVTEDRSLVKGIIDRSCEVAGLIESNRDQGTVSGTLSIDGKNNMRMYYLTYTTLPRPGDLVVTSGIGLQLPKGIPIGTVRESTRGLEDNKQFIVIEPIADFDHIEYVIVYRYRPNYTQQEARPRVETSFAPLPSIQPVPTFIGQPAPAMDPDASVSPELETTGTPAPSPSRTPSPEDTPSPTGEVPDDFIYNAPALADATPTPDLFPEYTSTPEPTPTFSPRDMTVEEDP
ncbi:MAG: rod shape-determining protein MreC [Eubacteriales bacterium]|nr:rod shape-determining protein MreC [Eubacteriales bacterium]